MEKTCRDCKYCDLLPNNTMFCKIHDRHYGYYNICQGFKSLEHVTFWMVFVDCQKIPKLRHNDYDTAKAEAERLAKHSNAEVALIECKSIRTCKATKKVEWGE